MSELSLPATSFAKLSALRLAAPTLFWASAPGLAQPLLERYAYCMPLPGDDPAAYGSDTKFFFSDRYGGTGMKRNGGGARCGVSGKLQIKGIGRTPLAGSRTSFWHSYGGESRAGGVRDAIWGELCNMALPWGAARVAGIIATGTTIPRFGAGTELANEPRSLTIRDFTIRPAHFVRALYFSRSDEQANGLIGDAARTEHAVRTAGQVLSGIYGEPGQAIDINAALFKMAGRFAEQLAAANAKRIVHGALCASNICLDGRWVDFGTASTVSDYGRIMVGNHLADAWDSGKVHALMQDLVQNLRRYLPPPVARTLAAPPDLLAFFDILLAHRRKTEFVKLTGIPEEFFAAIGPARIDTLYAVMQVLMRAGNAEPFQLYRELGDAPGSMPPMMGTYHLNTLMTTLALSDSAAASDRQLCAPIADAALRARLVAAYWQVREAFLAAVPDRSKALHFMLLNCLRLNTALPQLYRHTLDQTIDQLLTEQTPIDLFIRPLLAEARTVLAPVRQGAFALEAWLPTPVVASLGAGFLRQGKPVPTHTVVEQLAAPALTPHMKTDWLRICNTAS